MKNHKLISTSPLIIECEGDWDALRKAITYVGSNSEVKGVMVFACESNGLASDNFNEFLRTFSKPVFGGVFPALISNGEYLGSGNIVLGLNVDLDVYLLPSLSDPSPNYNKWLIDEMPPDSMLQAKTMFVFVDGMAPRVGDLMDSLFNTFGLQGNFVGGGAGSLTNPNLPCLITNKGMLRDAAVLVAPKMLYSQVSVAHGWLPIAGPFEVTGSDKNVILTLDWEPAIEVYKRILETQVGTDFDFATESAVFPFGMTRLNMEFVVRDLVGVREDGGLVCTVDIPRGTLTFIMNGNSSSMLSAAAEVRQMANSRAKDIPLHSVDIVIDCISRGLYLGENVRAELNSLSGETRPLVGAFTLGEIANSGKDCLEFHNKSVVVATIWS
jgi:hypothetical protein